MDRERAAGDHLRNQVAPTVSLVRRVARTTAIVAAIGAVVTALVSGWVAARHIAAREDQRLRDAALTLSDELGPPPGPANWLSLVHNEQRELGREGLRLAVFERGQVIGGATDVPALAQPGCVATTLKGESLRACGMTYGRWMIAVAGATDGWLDVASPFLTGGIIAVLATIAAASLASRRIADWVIGPVTRLQRAVEAVPEHAPGSADLGPAEGWGEVESLRTVLKTLLQRLDRTLTQAQRFAADAAHELRTPLTTMRAELELLAEESESAATREALGRVHRTLLSVSALMERLLILALPRRAGAWDGQPVSLTDVARESHAALGERARGRVALTADDDAVVRGDSILLRSMLDNAIDNALKFSGAAPVTVSIHARPDSISCRIQDRGPGLSPAERERVFQPFYRTVQSRSHGIPGHGIGLALIAHVAAGHGGDARFLDTPEGALLEVRLPVWKA